jgi:hypothetical protein
LARRLHSARSISRRSMGREPMDVASFQ